MPGEALPAAYRMLDAGGVVALLAGLDEVRSRLGNRPASWRVREVGDGNLNLVFIVEGERGAVCVKQALPYVRAAGPSWPMSLERAYFENAYYTAVAPHVEGRVPAIYHYDPALYCSVMERLSPHIILRQGLIAGRRYAQLARDLGQYVAAACFFTSDLAWPFERKLAQAAVFAGNTALMRISVELIFADPYREHPRNRHTAPYLDGVAAELRRDVALKLAVARWGQKFLTHKQALLHGDLHSGSVMVTAANTRVIDPEFAFYGPIGFDLGAFFGNLLLSWYAQAGHTTAADDRSAQQAWILDQALEFWQTFRRRFLALWAEHAQGDLFHPTLFAAAEDVVPLQAAREQFVDTLEADMVGFAACKMIRRIVGFAHVLDFESIESAERRAERESRVLALARLLLTHPAQFSRVDAVLDAVPRMG